MTDQPAFGAPALRYSIKNGDFYDGPVFECRGYSGHGPGLNNIAMVRDAGVGPIPPGLYAIGKPLDPPDHLGPLAMPLTPIGHDALGRSAFFIHGDNNLGDQSASHGCIILGHAWRAHIDAQADRRILVTP